MKRYKITIWCDADQVEHGLDCVASAVAHYESGTQPSLVDDFDEEQDTLGDWIGRGLGTTVVVEEVDVRANP